MPALIDLVLPCLDEAQALPWIMGHLPPGVRAVVVDNGSTDGSAGIARALGATVIECRPRGYGAACHAGLAAADAEFVAVCDCDASIDPRTVLAAVDLLRAGADLVVGRRVPVNRAAWSPLQRIANRALAGRVRRRTGLALRDVGPLRVARRAPLLALGIADRRSGYPVETVVRAAAAGWRVVPLDIAYAPRVGRSKVTGTVRGTLRAIRDMDAVLRRAPADLAS